MLALYFAINCLTPLTGWYDVVYTKVSGNCPDFKKHQQYLSFTPNSPCKQTLRITKSKGPYTATFEGDLTWDINGANINSIGKVTVTNLWGGTCQGIYKVNLQ